MRQLASELRIAPGTVARAYATLETQGLITTDGPGLGYGLIRAAEGVATHVESAAGVARRLQTATSIRRAAPLVAELRLLMYRISEGGDSNGDGEVSLEDEAGVQQLEAHVYLLLVGEGLPRVLR